MEPPEPNLEEFNPDVDLVETLIVPEGTTLTETGEVDWDQLPDTVGCQLVKSFHDYAQIRSISAISHKFQGWAELCLEKLDSVDLIQIPLSVVTGYRALRETKNIIFSVNDDQDVAAMGSLFNLTKAVFIFPTGDVGVKLFSSFLTSYLTPVEMTEPSGRTYTIRKSILNWKAFSFGFTDQVLPFESAIAIGNNKLDNMPIFLIYLPLQLFNSTANFILPIIVEGIVADRSKKIDLIGNIEFISVAKKFTSDQDVKIVKVDFLNPALSEFKRLRALGVPRIQRRALSVKYQATLSLIKHQVVNFLRLADLGLVDPLQPPSINNPPLKTKLPITVRGISTKSIIKLITRMYVSYIKRLYGPPPSYILDDLMTKYFGPLILKWNEGHRGKIDLANFNFAGVLHLSSLSMIDNMANLDYNDLINLSSTLEAGLFLIDDPELTLENQYVHIAFAAYKSAKQQQLPYYLTDGSRVNPDGSIDPPV